jgi:hypothetical protein
VSIVGLTDQYKILLIKFVFSLASVLQCCKSLVISLAWSVSKVPDLPAVSIMGLYAHADNRVQEIARVSIVFFISIFFLSIKLVDGTSNDEV